MKKKKLSLKEKLKLAQEILKEVCERFEFELHDSDCRHLNGFCVCEIWNKIEKVLED